MLAWLTFCDCDSMFLLMSVSDISDICMCQRVYSREDVRQDLWESVDRSVGIVSSSSILHTSPPLIYQHNPHWFDLVWFDQQFSFFVSISNSILSIQRHGMQHLSWLWCRQSSKICDQPSSWSDIAEIVDDTSLGKPQQLDDLGNWDLRSIFTQHYMNPAPWSPCWKLRSATWWLSSTSGM